MGRTVESLRDGVVLWNEDSRDDDCVGVLLYETSHQSFFEHSQTRLYDEGTAYIEGEVYWKVPGELV